jgi:DNA-binding transcriptional regulator GbsR (MarR family)
VRLPRQPPANDNGLPAVIPVFPSLLRRHDLTRTDVLVYGALLAFSAVNRRPRVHELAAALGVPRSDKHMQLRACIRKLEALQLVRRVFVNGKTTHYVPLGPIAACG